MVVVEKMKPYQLERVMVSTMRETPQCVLVVDEDTLSTLLDCVIVVNKHMPILRTHKTEQLEDELRELWDHKYRKNPNDEE